LAAANFSLHGFYCLFLFRIWKFEDFLSETQNSGFFVNAERLCLSPRLILVNVHIFKEEMVEAYLFKQFYVCSAFYGSGFSGFW